MTSTSSPGREELARWPQTDLNGRPGSVGELGGDINQGSSVNTRKGENFLQQLIKALLEGQDFLHMETSPKLREVAAEMETLPVSNVVGQAASNRQACLANRALALVWMAEVGRLPIKRGSGARHG